MVIDWKKFEGTGKFVSFEDNTPKKLIMTNWREDTAQFGSEPARPALKLDVLSEDGNPCQPPKELTAANHTLVMGLRPVIEKAEKEGAGQISVAVQRSGQGKGTKYVVMAL